MNKGGPGWGGWGEGEVGRGYCKSGCMNLRDETGMGSRFMVYENFGQPNDSATFIRHATPSLSFRKRMRLG